VRRVLRSFAYAFAGIATVARTQTNFRIHLVAAVLALAAGLALGLSPVELAVLVLTIALVLAAESLNSAVEALCDLVSPQYHPLIERAKDISAGAVLITAIASVIVAVLLFVPRLL
jgi:diacylglycerol kinase